MKSAKRNIMRYLNGRLYPESTSDYEFQNLHLIHPNSYNGCDLNQTDISNILGYDSKKI